MSVERIKRQSGVVWRVRWRDEAGNARSKVCGTKRDADAYDVEIKRRKRMGDLAQLDAGRQTLAEFAEDWWRLYAVLNVSERARRTYAGIFDKHLLPRIGGMRMRDITPEVVAGLRADLESAGVGPSATRKTLFLLQGMFRQAIAWRRVADYQNPVVAVDKPSGQRVREVIVLPPSTVEAMRAELRKAGRLRDATLICVIAYAGLRPGEALGLRWDDIRDRIIRVERAVVDGAFGPTKTKKPRAVRLFGPLAADLAEWRLASGRPDGEKLVFPRPDGTPWHDHDWKNWSKRTYGTASRAVGVEKTRAYDLRHSFCSLLIYEGKTVVEVAAQAGHSPAMTLSTYGHVIAELQDMERMPAEAAIRAAREGHVSEECPPEAQAGGS